MAHRVSSGKEKVGGNHYAKNEEQKRSHEENQNNRHWQDCQRSGLSLTLSPTQNNQTKETFNEISPSSQD